MAKSLGLGLVCGGCNALGPRDAIMCGDCGAPLVLGQDPADVMPRPSPVVGGAADDAPLLADDDMPALPGPPQTPPPPRPGRRGPGAEAVEGPPRPSAGPMRPSAPPAGPPTGAAPPPGAPTCPSCGDSVPSDYRFCGRCGAVVAAPAGPAAEPEGRGLTLPADHDGGELRVDSTGLFTGFAPDKGQRARVVMVHGEGVDGTVYGIKGVDALAGRTRGQILFPDDDHVSPAHARFFYREDRLFVRDEGSANGVYLRIADRTQLEHGDLFLSGEQLMRFEVLRPPPDIPDGEGTYFLGCRISGNDFRLVQLLAGGRPGLVYLARHTSVAIGREGCDLNFPHDRFMSRRHARVESDGSRRYLADAGSRNGTFIRLKCERQVHHGDHLFIGQQLLRVEI